MCGSGRPTLAFGDLFPSLNSLLRSAERMGSSCKPVDVGGLLALLHAWFSKSLTHLVLPFQGSFFLENLRKPMETDPVFAKNDGWK